MPAQDAHLNNNYNNNNALLVFHKYLKFSGPKLSSLFQFCRYMDGLYL